MIMKKCSQTYARLHDSVKEEVNGLGPVAEGGAC